MQHEICIADISHKFGEFCTKHGRVIAQHMGTFIVARLVFFCLLSICPGVYCTGGGGGVVRACGGALLLTWSLNCMFSIQGE